MQRNGGYHRKEMMVRQSVCALDCPDCCSLLINVDEAGRGSRLRGNPEHPITRGFLCGKVAKYLEREYSTERLLYPLRRTGAKGDGRFARISWDEALDEIAERLKRIAAEHGPEAILPYSYAGSMGKLIANGMDRRFFHRLGASRLDRTICSSAGGAGLLAALGVKYGTEPEQFRHSKLILGWGANILATNVHLWPFIVEARRNGARFYTIDPIKQKVGELADRHFFIYPGTDAALALGMMHVIIREKLYDAEYVARYTDGFEELVRKVEEFTPAQASTLTGVAAEDIVMLAREYATVRPAAIRLNYGMQRSERGGMGVRLISYLPVLTGSWREAGGGLQLSTSGAFVFNDANLQRPDLQQIALGREARLLNMAPLGQLLNETRDPAVHALFVYCSNPAAIAPDQNSVRRGLRRDELFTVVIEQMQTDTADFADIVLPSTTFLEHTDVYLAYGHYYLQMARPALPAPGECRSNVEIFRELAKRMGFAEPCFEESEDDMIRGMLDSRHPFFEGITLERLERERSIRLNISSEGEPFLPFANGNFGTASGKCEFRAETIQYEPPVESRHGDGRLRARFPLELVSAKNHNSMNSTFGNRDDVDEETAWLTLHPEDATARGIAEGDRVRIFNQRGSCFLTARVRESVPRGVVSTPSTRWPKKSPDRQNVNVLTSQRLTDMGGGPTFYNCLVEVERAGD
ncbi:MAG TPA: molybdopterin oxidoreductase family protein [Bryobacteraceae bacterium]|jgi:anaerobic selenocysteine-containing dehydrogenase|nr:molybdopterin oxidoreductase family protein [Bryobacteraceae bacterium]